LKALIADDEPSARSLLQAILERIGGWEIAVVDNGDEAWSRLENDPSPCLVILDWMMPGLQGPQICRLVRESPRSGLTYLILTTARGETEDLVAGLEAGADDYVAKPFDHRQLMARIRVGRRVLTLQNELNNKVEALAQALEELKACQARQ
jgi:DNA-binding response OmpR family regulator